MGELLNESVFQNIKKIVDTALNKIQLYKDNLKSYPDRDSKLHDVVFAELREIFKYVKNKAGNALYLELADIQKLNDEADDEYETPGGPGKNFQDVFYDLKLSLGIIMSLLSGEHSGKGGNSDMKIALESLQAQMDKKQKMLMQRVDDIDDIKDSLKSADLQIQKSMVQINRMMDQSETQKRIQELLTKINDIDQKALAGLNHTSSKRKPILNELLRRLRSKVLETRFKFGELIYGPQPIGIAPKREWKALTLLKTGEIYEGEWKAGSDFIEGKGISIHEDGTILEGWFKNDLFHGEGRAINPDGSAYDGEWKEGKKHGKGLMTYVTGDRYMGEYQEGKKNGKGIYTWPNGNEYDGEFVNGVSEGKGTYFFADGSKYEGQWKNDKKHGMGTFFFADGTVRKGWWDNGEPYQWID